jgi:PAS domain S-box-containing protein
MEESGFRSVFEHSNDAIFIFDVEADEILEANPQAASLLGYERAELTRLGPSDIHPDELPAFREFVRTVRSEGSGWSNSLSCLTKTGTRVPAEISATTFEFDGREAVLASVRDVSGQHERERALEELADTTERLMRLHDPDDIAAMAVEAAHRILDLELSHLYLCSDAPDGAATLRPAAVTDTFEARLGEPPTFEEGDGLLWAAMAAGEPRYFEDVRREAEMATDLPFRNAMLFPLGDHGVLGIASTSDHEFEPFQYDVADILASQVHAALDRAERLDDLERTNETLEEFASIVSHDLRNPLTVAQGHLELAREEHESDHHAEIDESLDRMESLIDGLLATARAGKLTVELERCPLGQVADACWQHVATADATITVAEDATVCADEQLLQQLLENLFRNSVEHGSASSRTESDDAVEHGGDGVAITVGRLDDGFYVADDGPGIPADEREQVFELGHSGDDDGTGLGLGIVARIVDAHDWSVAATESEDGGARFEFTGIEFG